MIKVAIISDLHQDHWKTKGLVPAYLSYTNSENADVLIIAGDLDSNVDDTCKLADHFFRDYKHVLFTDGNHEHYSGKHTVIEFENLLSINSKAIYLNGNSIVIDDVGFVG